MYSVITDAASTDVLKALEAPMLGNRRIGASVRLAPGEPGAIIVTVQDWAGTSLNAALKRLGAWFDRALPPGRVPSGRPIVSHAGASSIRNQRKLDGLARKDRAIRRAMKGTDA
jgi:hypothetical protein